MIVVDHPAGTEAYTSMTNYLNKGSTGQIYTTSNGPLQSPITATNEKGQNVLPQILHATATTRQASMETKVQHGTT